MAAVASQPGRPRSSSSSFAYPTDRPCALLRVTLRAEQAEPSVQMVLVLLLVERVAESLQQQ